MRRNLTSKPRPAWVWLAGLLGVWAVLVMVVGGFQINWHGIRISSHQWSRPFLATAIVVGLARWRRGWDGFQRDLVATSEIDFDRWGPRLAYAVSLVVLVVGLVWSTRVAGGADSYGYVSQSRLWLEGRLIVEQPIAAKVPWPSADWTFTPLGYKPTATGHAIVPIYAPGLPMLMAILSLVHPDGVFWVVPLAGGALVALSFFLGRALGGSATGLLSATLVATSPAILFQLVAPMSDVVVAMFWIAALVAAIRNSTGRWLAAGLASSLAILTRPNTAPIAGVFFLIALWKSFDREDGTRHRRSYAMAYVTGIAPGVLSVAAIHTALYGSPLESGYGSARDIYAFVNLLPNLARYPVWLTQSETPFICLAALTPFLLSRSKTDGRLAIFIILVAATTWLCYLFYQPFEAWWYLRFLLTSLPCLLALAAVPFVSFMGSVGAEWRVPLGIALLALLLSWRIDYAIDAGTFESWRSEQRYAKTGQVVAEKLPSNAILFSVGHSGSLRYYSHRLTLRWDSVEPAWLDRSVVILNGLGLKPYFVFDEGEEIKFTRQFAPVTPTGRLDWTPVIELKTSPPVRIYDPDQANEER